MLEAGEFDLVFIVRELLIRKLVYHVHKFSIFESLFPLSRSLIKRCQHAVVETAFVKGFLTQI